MPKVSVIVPVYKAEKYLRQCIESILVQTFTDWECILVDDGSPDNSGTICDEYAVKDSRIRVMHIKNGGVSKARNTGIMNAKGEWLFFLDSDDTLYPDTFEYCLQRSYGYDVIRFSMIRKYNDHEDAVHIIERNSRIAYLKDLVGRNTILGVCGGCYKRTLFEDNGIYFDPIISNGEDWLVSVELVLASSQIIVFDKPLYAYNMNNVDSCTSNYSLKKEVDKAVALNRIKVIVGSTISSNYYASAKIKLLLQGLSACFANSRESDGHFKDESNAIVQAYGGYTINDLLLSRISFKDSVLLFLLGSRFGRALLKIIVK